MKKKNEKVTDIYLCYNLKLENTIEKDSEIYFSFYEEEKVNFKPTLQHLIKLQRVEKAIDDFNKLELSGLVPFQDVLHWFDSIKDLADELRLGNPFIGSKYKGFEKIKSIYRKVSNIVNNYTNNQIAQDALRAYYHLNKEDEKMMVRWLLKYKRKYFYSPDQPDNWQKTGIIVLETEPNLIIDCSDFLESFIFPVIYYNLNEEIMNRYQPTAVHYEQNGGRVICSLENYLKLHNKYLDLL